MNNSDKKHISYSEIASWLNCNNYHKLKYIDEVGKELFTQNEFTEFGHVLHEAAQGYLKTKESPNIAAIRRKLSEALVGDNVKILSSNYNETEWLDAVEPILTDIPTFFDKEFANWEFVAAEEQLFESIGSSDMSFKGFIDLIVKVPKASRLKRVKDPESEFFWWILDFKTASFGWTPEKKRDFNKLLQLVLYKDFWCKKNNIPLSEVRCGFVLLKRVVSESARKNKIAPSCELVPVSVGEKTLERGQEIVQRMISSSKKGFAMKNRDHCKWCEFRGTKYCTG